VARRRFIHSWLGEIPNARTTRESTGSELTAPNCSLSRREISLRLGVKREIMLLAARRTHATPEKATVLF
jgi:hypothetical protein